MIDMINASLSHVHATKSIVGRARRISNHHYDKLVFLHSKAELRQIDFRMRALLRELNNMEILLKRYKKVLVYDFGYIHRYHQNTTYLYTDGKITDLLKDYALYLVFKGYTNASYIFDYYYLILSKTSNFFRSQHPFHLVNHSP